MNKQEYERWETPAPKKSNNKKWFILGLLALFALYILSGLKISYNHDFNKEEVKTEDVVSPNEVEESEDVASQSAREVIYHNDRTDKTSHIADVTVKKANDAAEQALEDANKFASQAVEDANKAVEDVLGTPYQSHMAEPKKQKDDSELSTMELLERKSHARIVEQAKRAGVSTEGSDMDILDRISHKRIVEQAKRAGVSAEGSDMDILDRISHKRIVEQAKRAGVSAEGSDIDILDRISHKRIVEQAKRAGVSAEGSDMEILDRISRKRLERMGR